ncbi:hypothetical protein OAA07_00405 [bacterium]|jgi:hypothetical protein|nr:hypothetical protein [bacterium]
MSGKIIQCTVAIAIAINIVLPMLLKPFATASEIKPPNGAANLPFKSQLMHMFVHHAQVPVSSSAIIAVIVALSLTICKTMCKNQRL